MNIVSLFCGAGGLDLGFIHAGHKIIWANDIYEDAVATYERNIGAHVDTRDISAIKSTEIENGEVIVGGFPCQGFSVANWTRSVNDERNKLYREMVRVISDKKPKFFVAENVKGLVSLAKGEVLRNIISDFSNTGFKVYWKVLNCADYGVPQTRQRLIIFGIREDVHTGTPVFPPKPTHHDPRTLPLENGSKEWVNVGRAVSHFPDPDSPNDIPNHKYSKYKLRFNGHLGHRFIDPEKPAPTVTGRGDERGGVVVLHHPSNERRMSARELAAVQSFPDDYVFEGNNSSVYRQIANAVPPLLGKAIGTMLMQNEELYGIKLAEAV